MTRSAKGFTLIEFIVGIVFIGVVLGPFLVFVTRIHDLNSALAQQARREAWRSFADEAVAHGIDPAAPALGSAVNRAIPCIPPVTAREQAVGAVPGLPSIVPLNTAFEAPIPEPRMLGGGFQIGAGTPVPPRTAPTPPLAPIVMPVPVVTPADGSIIPAGTLTVSAPGAPPTIALRVTSATGTRVRTTLNQPAANLEGTSSLVHTLNAVELANLVSGVAWTEYPGDNTAGHRRVALEDGRVRWLVTTPERRLQIFEPSPRVPFEFRIGLGRPVLTRGSDEFVAGATLAFDHAAYCAVRDGAMSARIEFPGAVRNAFGTGWPATGIGFQWTFNNTAGPFSGEAGGFFADDRLALWADTFPVTAVPIVPRGAVADAATWTFTRVKSQLGVPVLTTEADAAGFYPAGQVQFTAPPGPDGSPVGRLSFENGTALSTGSSLSISVKP